MINNIKNYPGLWGFGIISVLWILGIIFAGEILFIDTIELGCGSEILSSVFPFAFLMILTWIAYISKRNCMKTFFVSSYVFAAIPIVSTIPGFLYGVFEDNAVLGPLLFALGAVHSVLFGMPVVAVTGAVAYSEELAFSVLVLSLIISVVCYLTVKEKVLDRP
jgi:hypothetical protein